MPKKDFFHEHIKAALIQDGWTITHDPLYIKTANFKLPVDLGAEKIILAEKVNQKIAVEIKSFLSQSPIAELHEAVGQFGLYLLALEETEPDRELYIAMPEDAYNDLLPDPFIEKYLKRHLVKLIIYDTKTPQILSWKKD